jgi:ribosomal protein S18 acetylase RimI-like enzyme
MTTIRPATEQDLAAIQHIFYLNETQGTDDPPPHPTGMPPLYQHIAQTGTLYVAEQDGRVQGFAGAITRGTITYLTDLFVHPAIQSSHLGKTLLQHTLPSIDQYSHCTMSSTDYRALALYIRAGMQPQWPHFNLRLTQPVHDARWQAPIEISEAEEHDTAALVQWDTRIGGRLRPQEHQYWRQRQSALPLWFHYQGQIIGYGYVRLGAGTLWYPNACTIGPLGVNTPEHATDCVLAAVNWALQHAAAVIRIDVPGPHPCLTPLLERGFHIVYLETFVSNAASPFFDACCYIASGSDLL